MDRRVAAWAQGAIVQESLARFLSLHPRRHSGRRAIVQRPAAQLPVERVRGVGDTETWVAGLATPEVGE